MSQEAMAGGTDLKLEKAIQHQMVMCEERTIKEALRRLLDREPTIEDGKACGQILSDPWDGTYILTYNGIKVGIVKYINEPEKFRVEFQPFAATN